MKFRSRYAEVAAMLFDGTNFDEMYAFAGEHVTLLGSPGEWEAVKVHTNNGTVDLPQGHFLIQGAHDFYPCDPDTFNVRWEQIPDEVKVDSVRLSQTDDAMVWAEEFVKLVTARPVLAQDEGVVVGWFANAIEGAKNRESNKQAVKEFLDGE